MKTGFIGLGKMGSVMAPRLADQATQLRGFDPNWHLPADSSVQPAPSIAALADCEIIFTMVPDGSVVVEIIEILLDAGTDALLVDMSSCHPDTSGQLASLLAKTGQRVLDAPVSGGSQSPAESDDRPAAMLQILSAPPPSLRQWATSSY